jgi:hypothetical protein
MVMITMNIEKVMDRIKNLQEFEVMVQVPEDFTFAGPVPYDMHVSGDVAFVKIVAANIDEATKMAHDYFNPFK